MTTRKWTITLVGLVVLLVVAAVLTRELRQQPGASSNIVAGLTIEEYPIVAADVDSPGHFEFLDRIPDDVLARREAWRGFDAEQRVSAMNEILAPFGCRLTAEENAEWQETFYDFYCEDDEILSDLRHIWPISVNESGMDFAFVAENGPNKRPFYLLIRSDGVQPVDWERFVYGVVPVYLGDDLISAETLDDQRKEYPVKGGVMVITPYAVKRGDDVVYTYTPSKQYAGSPPVKRLAAWEGHWILETVEEVFVDGESLNEQLGVDEVFHCVTFQGQPLFFFEEDRQVSISYGGETLPISYDRVPHYWCCEPATFNVKSNEHMLWFYALKDGIWHYVEMGVYDE